MKRVFTIGIAGCLLANMTIVLAYEPGTHAQLSDAASKQSVLVTPLLGSNTTVLQDLGLKSYTDTSHLFPDIQGQQNEWVYSDPDHTVKFQAAPEETVQQLISSGAQLEDEGDRPLNHFYDSAHDSPLTLAGKALGEKTPAWAQTSSCMASSQNGYYDPSGDDKSASHQCFSLADARTYFTNALTNSSPNVRDQQFGDLFLTLGHVTHLVQDMAQPQHVRNDMHCDEDACLFVGLYNPSLYETYVYNQTKLPIDISIFATYPTQTSPVVNLPTAQAYWSTAGFGLADFTNSNFVSAGTNFSVLAGSNAPIPSSQYEFPEPSGTSTESINAVYQDIGQPVPADLAAYCTNLQAPLTCNVTMVQTQINDVNYSAPGCAAVTGLHAPSVEDTSCVNMHASSYSIFQPDLVLAQTDQGQPVDAFTLNADNLQSAMNYLLPRAIGYSAGLINYFFRGRLGVQPDPNNIDNYIVSNLSGYELKGSIEFYYDDPYGNRYPITTSKTTVDLPGLPSGSQTPSTQSIQVIPPAYPQAPSTGSYMAVFDGAIGTEPGVAGKQVEADKFYVAIEKPGGFSPFFRCEDGTVQTYASAGILANESDSGMPLSLTYKVAVVGGAVFTSFGGVESQDFDGDGDCDGALDYGDTDGVSDGPANYYVMRNGQVLLTLPAGSNFDDFATSDKNLFALSEKAQSPPTIDIYDLAGNVAAATDTLNPHFTVAQYSVAWVAANDSVICVTGDDSNDNAQDLLYSLNGTLIATLTGHDGDDDYCGASSNRIYVARNPDTGPYYVDVYDNSGTLITSIPLDAGASPYGVAATDTRVYVLYSDNNGPNQAPPDYGFEQGVAIYQRNVGNGPDTFTLLRKTLINDANVTNNARGIAVDMQSVLNAPAH